MGRGIDSQPGKVYSSESIPWFLKCLQIQAQLGGGRGKAAPLKSRGFLQVKREGGGRELVLGKHPDLMVGPPTATVFPTNDRKFEISQFFAKNFETV